MAPRGKQQQFVFCRSEARNQQQPSTWALFRSLLSSQPNQGLMIRTQGTRRRDTEALQCPGCGCHFAMPSTSAAQRERYVRYTKLKAGRPEAPFLHNDASSRLSGLCQKCWHDVSHGYVVLCRPDQQDFLQPMVTGVGPPVWPASLALGHGGYLGYPVHGLQHPLYPVDNPWHSVHGPGGHLGMQSGYYGQVPFPPRGDARTASDTASTAVLASPYSPR